MNSQIDINTLYMFINKKENNTSLTFEVDKKLFEISISNNTVYFCQNLDYSFYEYNFDKAINSNNKDRYKNYNTLNELLADI
jgi:hypothetical protein